MPMLSGMRDSGLPFDQIVNTGECDPKHFSGEVSWNHNRNHSHQYSVEQLMHGHLNPGAQAAGRVFCGLHGSALTMIWTLPLKNFWLFLILFLMLFTASGFGNGATYRMIPVIFATSSRAARVSSLGFWRMGREA